MKTYVEQLATTSAVTTYPSGYDSTKWNLGKNITQQGSSWIGPMFGNHARPFEESTAFNVNFIDGFQWNATTDLIFGCELAVGATRRISKYEFNKTTGVYTWKGFITFTMTNATTVTRGFKVCRYQYTTGTVGVSGTSVTGSGAAWVTNQIASGGGSAGAGARIGFGSTDPTAITQWYYISSVGGENAITLTLTAGTIAGGTPYVIEEIRPVIVTTNTTATNGGVFVAKGCNLDQFITTGTTIAASAATTDNLNLVYWLADAATVTNTTASAAGVDNTTPAANANHTNHMLYNYDVTTTKMYAYNMRSTDTISSGKQTLTGANIVITGAQAVTGTAAQLQSGIVATSSAGGGAGVKSYYFCTTTRIYRVAISNITAGNVSWQSDNRVEVAPGGSGTYVVTTALSSLDYMADIDRFMVYSGGASGIRSYLTKYPTTSGDQFDYIVLNTFLQEDGSTASSDSVYLPYDSRAFTMYSISLNGFTHLSKTGSAAIGQTSITAIPISTDWNFSSTTNSVAISPSIATPSANKYYKLYTNRVNSVGANQFITPLHEMRTWYRTTGISDNSGSWNLMSSTGDLSGASSATAIQFKFDFQMLGNCHGIPSRLLSMAMGYETNTTDSHYQPSATFSDAVNKRFAWRFAVAFGTAVPALRIQLFDAVTGSTLVDDNTTSPTGTFEKSIDGGSSWVTWTNADLGGSTTTYLRYTPLSLADNIKVRAILLQL